MYAQSTLPVMTSTRQDKPRGLETVLSLASLISLHICTQNQSDHDVLWHPAQLRKLFRHYQSTIVGIKQT
jgi:hypothetical protein